MEFCHVMGNGNSGQIYVERQFFHPGDVVTGTFFLNIIKQVSADSVSIKISGVEHTTWTTQRRVGSGKHARTVTDVHRGTNEIFKFKVPICGACDLMGQYAFPFTFTLPNPLPGSFMYVSGSTSAVIEFKIKGTVDIPGFLKPDIKNTLRITVLERPNVAVEKLRAGTESEITTCCCFSRGSVGLEISLEKNLYCPGETLSLQANINNRSTKNITSLRLELLSVLRILDSSGRQKTVVDTITYSEQIQGVSAGSSICGAQLSLTIPQQVSPQSLGFLVRHHYVLNLRGAVAWSTDAVISTPIGIFSVSDVTAAVPVMTLTPDNWHPTVAPVTALVYPNALKAPEPLDYSNNGAVQYI